MKKILLFAFLMALGSAAFAQSSNANIGGVNFGAGAATPAACKAPSYFYNSTTSVYSICNSGGTYAALGFSGGSTVNPSFTGVILGPDGTLTAPTYSFTSTPGAGFWLDASAQPTISKGGVARFNVETLAVSIPVGNVYCWATTTVGTACNAGLSEDAAGVVDVGNGSAANKTGFLRSGNTVRVASNFTTINNTSLQTITGLSWTFPATGTMVFSFHCHGSYSIATGAVAVGFGIQAATAAPTNIEATGEMYTAAAVATQATLATLASTTATQIVAGTPGSTGVNNAFDLYGTIENPASTANTYNIMVSTGTGADVVTVLRGAFCTLE